MQSKISRRTFGKILAASAGALALPSIARAAGAPVKIGFAAQTEGPALREGRSYTRGFKTALSYINNKGGILGGRQAEGVLISQGLTGETARAAALRLAQRDEVKALVGPMYSDTAPAGLSVAQRFNLIFAPDQGGMWLYEQSYKGTLGLSSNSRARTLPQIRWMEEQGYMSVVLLLSDIDYNRDVEKLVRETWEKSDSKVKLLDVIYYPYGQTQLQGELTKAIGANPDFIWSEEWSAPVAVSIMKICHDLQYKGGLSVTCSINQEIISEVPQEFSENVFSHMDFAPNPNVPANAEFLELWAKEWGSTEIPFRSEEVIFSQTVFLLLAMDKAGTEGDGSPEALQKIHDAMREVDWVSPRGSRVTLTDSGLGLFRSSTMTQIKGGKITAIASPALTPNDYLPSLPAKWES